MADGGTITQRITDLIGSDAFNDSVLTHEGDLINAAVHIYPVCNGSGQEGNIWTFTYIADGTDTTAMTGATLNSTYYMPSELIHAIALKRSVNILRAYLSNQVQDEEDIEIMQMLQVQSQVLEKDFLTEMQRYMAPEEKATGE